MNKHYNIFWLDDQRSKYDDMCSVLEAGIPERGISASVHFRELTVDALKNLEPIAEEIGDVKVDLIIVDHVFNQSGLLNNKGSSVAHLLRSTFPNIPIVCVSAAWGTSAPNTMFDQEDLSEYTYIFPFSRFADELELLYTIANDFPRCVEAVGANEAEFFSVSLLGAPRSEIGSLENILPSEFKATEQKTTPHRIARWILGIFKERPGYLYNELRTATLLGLSIEGFEKVKAQFETSLYRGVFATDSAPRWWVASIFERLAELTPGSAFPETQLAGRQLAGISSEDYSKCWNDESSVPPPDAVASPDRQSSEEVAVRSQHTRILPADIGGLPGFEPRLLLVKRQAQDAV